MFLKQKRCGIIKGHVCADRRKQMMYMSKEDTSLPTVMTEGLFFLSVIYAKECRDIYTNDIPGAIMETEMYVVVHMQFLGPLTLILTRFNPK